VVGTVIGVGAVGVGVLAFTFGVADAGSASMADEARFTGAATVVTGGVIAAVHLAAGWAIRRRKRWGRIVGMAVAGLALTVVAYAAVDFVVDLMALGPDYWSSSNADVIGLVGFALFFVGLPAVVYGLIFLTLLRAGRASRPVGPKKAQV
jgi:hypothetical protein